MNSNETIGYRIKTLRKNKGLTQLQLAEKMFVSDKAVSKWETGEGNPELSILIKLAEFFDVSLDFILIGKEKEPNIIMMNKKELCCKNDDVSLFETLDIKTLFIKDEMGKFISYYIEMYDCENVYKSFINKILVNNLITPIINGDINCDYEGIIKIMIKYNDLELLERFGFFEKDNDRKNKKTFMNIYNSLFLEQVFSNLISSEIILNKCLSLHLNRLKGSEYDWQTVYINMLDFSLKYNYKKLAEKIVKLIIAINEESVENYENDIKKLNKIEDKCYYKFAKHNIDYKQYVFVKMYFYSVVIIPKTIIKKLSEFGYFDYSRILNNYNKKFNEEYLHDGELEVEVLLKEGEKNMDKIFVVSCLEYGIVNIDKLLKCNNLKLVEYAFKEYPICFEEMLYGLFNKNEYEKIKEFSNEHKLAKLALAVQTKDEKYGVPHLEQVIRDTIKNVYLEGGILDVNRKYFIENKNTIRKSILEVKKEVLNELKLKLLKEEETKELTEEYYNSLLSSNNIELLIIKLCIRLEAVLKYDYKYEGSFNQMLKMYSNQHGKEDDGDGYLIESEKSKLFHKLRKIRNGITHSDTSKETITNEELKKIIKYVCSLG